ncbi:MAG: hypothetical protein ACI93T_002229 [Porticoccaceae bacterium]|jgi:hypothetical protein
MTGPIKALSWEFVRRMSVTVPLMIPMLVLAPLGTEGLFWMAKLPMEEFDGPPLAWHSVYLALGFMLIATPLVEAYKGACQRMFALPVSNKFIASWMMVTAIVAVVGQELLTHWLYVLTLDYWTLRAIFGDNRTLIGPCQPIFAATISILLAMFWSLKRFSFRKLFVWGVLLASLIYWIASHYYRDGFGALVQAWTTLTILDATVFVIVIAVSWFVTWKGIERERCGDNVGHSLENRAEVMTTWIRAIIFPDGVREHKSPEAAIAWNQWRHCGRDAALAAGLGFGTLLAILLFGSFGSRRGLDGIVVLLFLIPGVVGLLTGSILGILAPPSSRERITMFLATSPVSDVRLARGLMANVWRTTLIAWVLAIVPGLLALGAAIIRDGSDSFFRQIERFNLTSEWPYGAMMLPMALLASGMLAWTLTATLAVLHWTGNQFLPLFALVGVLAHVIILMLLSFFLEKETITWLREVSMSIAAIVIVAGSLWAFRTTIKRKMIEPGPATLLLSFWVVESLLCWFIVPAPPLYRLFVIGVLMLSVSPVAFAPLAISRNRHVA